jgi:hypothetical protein
MILTEKNIEAFSWLFSPTLQLMVREHELGDGKWDIEVDGYKPVGGDKYDPKTEWEPDTNIWSSYETFAEMIKTQPELQRVNDWIHGDKVTMW